jgi:hypothetical protein
MHHRGGYWTVARQLLDRHILLVGKALRQVSDLTNGLHYKGHHGIAIGEREEHEHSTKLCNKPEEQKGAAFQTFRYLSSMLTQKHIDGHDEVLISSGPPQQTIYNYSYHAGSRTRDTPSDASYHDSSQRFLIGVDNAAG